MGTVDCVGERAAAEEAAEDDASPDVTAPGWVACQRSFPKRDVLDSMGWVGLAVGGIGAQSGPSIGKQASREVRPIRAASDQHG